MNTESTWLNTKENPPMPGWIVKKWKNGSVWAGYYDGREKASSFDFWLPLPM